MRRYDFLLSISDVTNTGAPVDRGMREIIQAAERVFAEKSALYGNHLDQRDPEDRIAMFESYLEINRKYIRLNKFARDKLRSGDEGPPLIQVADTLLDLMIYSAMTLQLIFSRQEQKDDATRIGRAEADTRNPGGEVNGPADPLGP